MTSSILIRTQTFLGSTISQSANEKFPRIMADIALVFLFRYPSTPVLVVIPVLSCNNNTTSRYGPRTRHYSPSMTYGAGRRRGELPAKPPVRTNPQSRPQIEHSRAPSPCMTTAELSPPIPLRNNTLQAKRTRFLSAYTIEHHAAQSPVQQHGGLRVPYRNPSPMHRRQRK